MIAMVLAMLVKPNRLKPKTTTLRVLQGIFFFNAVVINTDYCVAKCCKKTLTTGKESATALRCTLADPGAVCRVEKYGGESFQERSTEPPGCHS